MGKPHMTPSGVVSASARTRSQTVSTTQVELARLLGLGGAELDRFVIGEAEKNPFLRPGKMSRSRGSAAVSPDYTNLEDRTAATFEKDVLDQISACDFSTQQAAIARVFFENMDERGLLPESVRAQIKGAAREVLDRLQALEPVGVFACGLAECYEIQLNRQDALTSEMRLLLAHLTSFESGGVDRLCAVTGMSQIDADRCLAQLKRLNPWPAYGRGSVAHEEYCIPEVAFFYDDGDVRVGTESVGAWVDEGLHRRICRANGKTRCPATDEAFSSARNLVTALEMRHATIIKIATVLANRQKAFLTGAEPSLNSLTMKDVAAEVGAHESTVSRAVRSTYARAPIGVIELRALFPQKREVNALSCAFTNDEIHTKLIELVRSELAPRSDSELCAELKAFGMDISRRTVAKYRSALKIPPATQRTAGELHA